MKKLFPILILFVVLSARAQHNSVNESLIRSFKPEFSAQLKHIDLDKDGDPDLIQSSLSDSIPIYWIDDDDDMLFEDREGDLDSDCLLIDRNCDGIFAGPGDLSLDWVDNNDDGIADMQVLVENSNPDITGYWDWKSNYMWTIDLEQDGVFHYINWRELALRGWSHHGASNFYEDYHGQTLFQKIHIPSYRFSDLRFSWENPFLFYDTDDDGLTEMTIRFEDKCEFIQPEDGKKIDTQPTGKAERAFLSYDLDNDNGPSNEFDFDMSLSFLGEVSYEGHIHQFENMCGLADADSLFYDNRWRTMDELVYADHDSAWSLIYDQGYWEQCWLVFDEDDDCERWERVEFYQPKDPFLIGMNKGGIDNDPQADAAGDRGEWDLDNSGKGKLYIGFDNRIHLYGAEIGYWRIDQDANSYQGWGGLYEGVYRRDQKEPEIFPTIAYEDTNGDGFLNLVRYDLNGDQQYEQSYDINKWGIQPDYKIISPDTMDAKALSVLFEESASGMWYQALQAVEAAKRANLNFKWYGQYLHPKSINEKYRFGYWLQFYLFTDFLKMAKQSGNNKLKEKVIKAYFLQNWSDL